MVGAVVVTVIITGLLTAKYMKRKFGGGGGRSVSANFESLYADRPVGGLGAGTKLIDLGAETHDDDTALLGDL